MNECPTPLPAGKKYGTFDLHVCIEKKPCRVKVFWVLTFWEVGDSGVRKPK